MYTKRDINVMNVPDEGVYHKHVMYTNRDISVMNVPDEGKFSARDAFLIQPSTGTFIIK
jgi:hypothetical protein